MRILNPVFVLAGLLAGCVITPDYTQNYPQDYPPASATPPASDAPAVDYDGSLDEVAEAPPPIPDYDQPPCPVEGYIWTPGLWQWAPAGYFWVPGAWVAPPAVGLLWTPGYWVVSGVRYVFHPGYWGRHVGYYGGINYGHGYFGSGYAGGRWQDNSFQYNRAVSNVNDRFHNTYDQRTLGNGKVDVDDASRRPRTGYAGGPGTRLAPTPREQSAAGEAHVPPTLPQIQQETAARSDPELNAGRNQGRPPIAAASTAGGGFNGAGVTAAKPGGPAYRPQFPAQPRSEPPSPPPSAPGGPGGPGAPGGPQHARDLPRPQSFPPAAPGNPPGPPWAGGSQAGADQAHARAQADLQARQEQQRQALALKQEQEHRSFAAQPAQNPKAFGAMEQRHQQQSQQLQQRQQQEQRQFDHQPPGQRPPQQNPH